MTERKTNQQLREKANALPKSPGVYIMYGNGGKIIYVGKSKTLHFRVSQYFQDGEKNVKTARMVSEVHDFDIMRTDTEIEALALENKLIKLHQPKYNIRLKDAKNYPYIKVDVNSPYPRITVTRKRVSDGSRYFGPYSGMSVAWDIVKTAQKTFCIPNCKLAFPESIGKVRPCLYSHIGQCCAPCKGELTPEEYSDTISDVLVFLKGSFKEVKNQLQEKMMFASRNLAFEAAASYRDRIKSLENLRDKQKVVGSPDDEYDVFALYSDESCSCLAVYYVRDGAVIDSDNFVFGAERIIDGDSLESFLADMYAKREYIPRTLLFGFEMEDERIAFLEEYLADIAKRRVGIRMPQKGDMKKLCDMVRVNAELHAKQYLSENERDSELLVKLAELAHLEVVPQNIEAIDISNYGDDNITAGLISVLDGRFNKSAYRTYKIKTLTSQDDYGSMREAIERRISHADKDPLPDLFLLDGGASHVLTVKRVLEREGIDTPVLGMVKDEYHKTRTLTDGESEISIAREQSVFVFIYKIQEEVHRYSISRMKKAKEKTMKHSVLEKINGIGQKKAIAVLARFGTLQAVKQASVDELRGVKGLSEKDAKNIYDYYHEGKDD